MGKVDFNQLIDKLCEYEDGSLDEWQKMYLKDDILDLSEQLHNEEITEGHSYTGMMILVTKGGDIPQPHKEFTFKSHLSEEPLTVKIKEITGLRQNNEGNLVVEVLAKKIRV